MKHIFSGRSVLSIFVVGFLAFAACEDTWNEHYNPSNAGLADKNLVETIEEDPSLSSFYQLLVSSGMDTVLGSAKSFTVWAPDNDALAGFNPANEEEARRTVNNHVTIGRVTTSNIMRKRVTMLNGKYNIFSRGTNGFLFGEGNVNEANVPATNGLIHKLDAYSPYLLNLWEYIGETEGLDSLRKYMQSQDVEIFDPINSIEIGVESGTNKVIYDSVFIYRNLLLDQLGALDVEDSIYTVLLPDNDAWNDAYARIAPNFVFADDAGLEPRQRKLVQQVLVKDLVFRGVSDNPTALDSVVSTTGTTFHSPDELFAGTRQDPASNGQAHITSKLAIEDTVSWFRTIKVEAESSSGRTNDKSDIFVRTTYGTPYTASNNAYILVEPTGPRSSVSFSIPNVLAGTYNIYVVFVPETIINPDTKLSIKTSYRLSYVRRQNGSSIPPLNLRSDDYVTDTVQMTKMPVAAHEFPFANVIDEDFSRVTTVLQVFNETMDNMRIDCIILEPVKE